MYHELVGQGSLLSYLDVGSRRSAIVICCFYFHHFYEADSGLWIAWRPSFNSRTRVSAAQFTEGLILS